MTSPTTIAPRRRWPRRVAVLSVHTSPLDQPGTGDAGGLNVYVLHTCRRLAAHGIDVDAFTRRTSPEQPDCVVVAPGLTVHFVTAGPAEPLAKESLPQILDDFSEEVLRLVSSRAVCGDSSSENPIELIHSHYWLSGVVGERLSAEWDVPHVVTAHTLAAVKNRRLAANDRPEPQRRLDAETHLAHSAAAFVVNTPDEAADLIDLCGAPAERVTIVSPGADIENYSPGGPGATERARDALSIGHDNHVIAFAGRIQPLKGPDVLVDAAACLQRRQRARPLTVLIVGGHSGQGAGYRQLVERAVAAGLTTGEDDATGVVRFLAPRPPTELVDVFRAADLVAVPSYSESFGLVALEAQASGTPVVAAAVGGLRTAVVDGVSGVLIDSHDPQRWADVLDELLADDIRRYGLAISAPRHAADFSWDRTTESLVGVYMSLLEAGPVPTATDSPGGTIP